MIYACLPLEVQLEAGQIFRDRTLQSPVVSNAKNNISDAHMYSCM